MQILVANNHLEQCGGTENYTYALIAELKRLGHSVEYFTFKKGFVSEKIEKELVVPFMSHRKYDLILANHNTCVTTLHDRGFVVQTCHGVFPKLEQPSSLANAHVGISNEVITHLKEVGVKNPKLILNGIDCERFNPKKPLHDRLTSVLSLCQSDSANTFIEACCKELGVSFKCLNKLGNDWRWNVEDYINDVDLVVGIGRSAYDAFACGRCVISFDERSYCGKHGDGYITRKNIDSSMKFNMSGRATNRTFDKREFINELMKYNANDGEFLRDFAVKNLNIRTKVLHYLSYI